VTMASGSSRPSSEAQRRTECPKKDFSPNLGRLPKLPAGNASQLGVEFWANMAIETVRDLEPA